VPARHIWQAVVPYARPLTLTLTLTLSPEYGGEEVRPRPPDGDYAVKRFCLTALALSAALPLAVAAAEPAPPDGHDHAHSGDAWPFGGKVGELVDGMLQDPAEARKQDPLRYVAGDMRGLTTQLGEYKTDKPVQDKQDRVVRTLDELITELEKQCKGGGAGGGGGNKPLARSQIVGGPGGQGDMIDPKKGDKQWANLPVKQREQILQSQTEGFPPGYEAILQSYYRRLSQEQVSPDGAAAPAPSPPTPAAPPAPRTPAPATQPNNP